MSSANGYEKDEMINDQKEKWKRAAVASYHRALLMTGSTGCSKQAADTKQKVEGLDKLGQIKVISREEGSGTRGTFAQLAGLYRKIQRRIRR